MAFDKAIVTRFFQVYGGLALMLVAFFAVAGRLDVPRAWLCFGLYFAYLLVNSFVMLRHAPQLIRERSKIELVKWWDKAYAVVYTLTALLIPAVAGLDAGGSGVPPLGMEFAAVGTLMFVASTAFISWAMLENRFFRCSATVQKGQKVISTGPYAIVRHPGYLGFIFMYGSIPPIIGSFYALVPWVVLAIAMIGRTYLEDKTLQEELPGYKAYTRKVKYRLVPLLW